MGHEAGGSRCHAHPLGGSGRCFRPSAPTGLPPVPQALSQCAVPIGRWPAQSGHHRAGPGKRLRCSGGNPGGREASRTRGPAHGSRHRRLGSARGTGGHQGLAGDEFLRIHGCIREPAHARVHPRAGDRCEPGRVHAGAGPRGHRLDRKRGIFSAGLRWSAQSGGSDHAGDDPRRSRRHQRQGAARRPHRS